MTYRSGQRYVLLKKVCSCKEQYPDASQRNIAKHFSILWDKPISLRCDRCILSNNKNKIKWEKQDM
jgi:hypothetical protein